MKKTYKFTSILIIISILLSAALFSRAADISSLTVDTQNGRKDDIVVISVKINSVSLGSLAVNLDYDESVLELQSVEMGNAGSVFNYSSANKVEGKTQLRFSGLVNDIGNVTVSGVLMTAKFKILKSSGEITLNSDATAYTADYNTINIEPANGIIAIYNTDSDLIFSADKEVLSANKLFSEFKNDSNNVVIKNLSGNVISGNEKVGTGSKIIIDNKVEIPVIVMADLNGDGERNINDYVLCRNLSVKSAELNTDQTKAADLNGDGVIDAFDTALMDLTIK